MDLAEWLEKRGASPEHARAIEARAVETQDTIPDDDQGRCEMVMFRVGVLGSTAEAGAELMVKLCKGAGYEPY